MNKKVINVKRKSLKDVQKVWRIIIQTTLQRLQESLVPLQKNIKSGSKLLPGIMHVSCSTFEEKKKTSKIMSLKLCFYLVLWQSFLLKLSPTMYTCMQSFGVGIIAV